MVFSYHNPKRIAVDLIRSRHMTLCKIMRLD